MNAAITRLKTHPELQALIPPLSDEERQQLTANLRAEGCRDALIVWEEENVILDGHNRYDICQTYEIAFRTITVSLPDLDAAKAWMLKHQLGRRNLTPEQISYLRGKQRQLMGQKGAGRPGKKLAQNALNKTDKQLAEENKVDVATIKRDDALAKAVDTIAAVAPEAKQTLLARDTKVAREDLTKLATMAEDNPQAARNVLAAAQAAETPKAAKQILREAFRARPKHEPEQPKAHGIPLRLVQETGEEQEVWSEEVPTADDRTIYIRHAPATKAVFNHTNEMVDWASWTWNPVTGCWHGCIYCYAREIAHNKRMAKSYPHKFEPTFHPYRLDAPANTPYPKELTRPADRNVFVCSMADLFGKWVPDDWIMPIFERVKAHPEWTFLFLTKFPQRRQEICDALGGFPDNAWVGCTVDGQARVATAEKAFRNIKAGVKWLSVEPMNERLTFKRLDVFDWLVIGGQSASPFNGTPASQPEWEWVYHLMQQATSAGVPFYCKENLTVKSKAMPLQQQRTSAVAMHT
jgi:protein gp37